MFRKWVNFLYSDCRSDFAAETKSLIRLLFNCGFFFEVYKCFCAWTTLKTTSNQNVCKRKTLFWWCILLLRRININGNIISYIIVIITILCFCQFAEFPPIFGLSASNRKVVQLYCYNGALRPAGRGQKLSSSPQCRCIHCTYYVMVFGVHIIMSH